jgi:hypothetical protein
MTMSTSSSKIHVVNLSSYTSPVIKEVQGKDWVEYGEDNNYFQYLIDRYNGSPTNNAILNSLIDLTYGKGLDATDSDRKPSEYAAMRGLFTKDCLKKLVADYVMMGQCAIQVVYSQDHNTIVEVEHIPVETLRAEKCNDEGEIEAYYYAKNWDDVKSRKETPVRIPAFGMSREGLEILYIKPYRAGFYYYSPVDYQGGLPYAELEEEVANYHINNIQNGLAPSMLINFNNGVPSEEERRQIEMQIAQKFSGSSNAGKFILAFNDNKELAATIDPVQLSDASEQYQFLSQEATQKIMVSHRIVSPMLLGIKDNSGLGNNADELKTASTLMDNIVIRPKQELILDGLETILHYNDIRLNLYFKTLQPLEFTEDIVTPMDSETREEETGVKLSAVDLKEPCWEGYEMVGFKIKDGQRVPNCVPIEASDEHFDAVFAELEQHGEVIDEEIWELVDEQPVDYAREEELNKVLNLAYVASAKPFDKSEQDKGLYKVRYAYAPNSVSEKSREFCRKMVNAEKVYRMEDIKAMSTKAVNAGFGPNGSATYDIWLYKGGARCHHFWMRKTYFRKRNPDGTFKEAPDSNASFEANEKQVSVNQARRAGVPLDTNPAKVAKRPVDMPNEGFLKPRK